MYLSHSGPFVGDNFPAMWRLLPEIVLKAPMWRCTLSPESPARIYRTLARVILTNTQSNALAAIGTEDHLSVRASGSFNTKGFGSCPLIFSACTQKDVIAHAHIQASAIRCSCVHSVCLYMQTQTCMTDYVPLNLVHS